jgi:hypothetical protein
MPPRQRSDRIPKRTSELELWDVNPVGTRDAWRRELLQFWSLMLTRGRRVRAQPSLMVLKEATQKNRSLTTDEIADLLAARIEGAPGSFVAPRLRRDLRRWLEDSIVVPGERSGRKGHLPSAGVSIPHYLGLLVFNRSVVRERFWAAFMYSAIASDLEAGPTIGRNDLAGTMLDAFLGFGLHHRVADPPPGRAVRWEVSRCEIAGVDPELDLLTRALAGPGADSLGDAGLGLPPAFFATSTEGARYPQFLCTGSIILMRRSLTLLLEEQSVVGHAALSELIETALVDHAALYYVRSMRVMNDLSSGRALPEDCQACWARFGPDLKPDGTRERLERWAGGDYRAAGDQADADWVDDTCKADDHMFINAGRKELAAAKELGRSTIERLRRQLAEYTVNRITLSLSRDMALRMATEFGEPAPDIDRIHASLDRWADEPLRRGVLSYAWAQRIRELSGDPNVPGMFLEDLDARLEAAAGDPRSLQQLVHNMVSETILSSRSFGRYIELLNSLLGGGALPSNEDPKGFMARGGSRAVPFHLALNDRSLEFLVAVAVLESQASGQSLSFQGFVDFLERRFHLLVDHVLPTDPAPSALVAEASEQSREALRSRLRSMGMLQEYSDSSEWTVVSWGTER